MKSKILDAVHHTATGLHKSGTITDVTMREFDKLCLLACEGDSHWNFFDGNYQEYEADKRKRLGE